MLSNWKDFLETTGTETVMSEDGNCNGCNDCCGYATPLSKNEFKELRKMFKNEYNIIFRTMINQNRDVNLMCPFSNHETGACKIYNNRPSVCKTYHCNLNFKKQPTFEKKPYKMYELYSSDIKIFLKKVHEQQHEYALEKIQNKFGVSKELIKKLEKSIFNK